MIKISFTFEDGDGPNGQLVKDFSDKVYTQFIEEKTRDPLIRALLNLEGAARIYSRRRRGVCNITTDSYEIERDGQHDLAALCNRIHGHMTDLIRGSFPEFAYNWFETRVTDFSTGKEEAHYVAVRL